MRTLVWRLTVVVLFGVFASIVMLFLQFEDGITGIDDQSIDVQVEVLRQTVDLSATPARVTPSAELQSLYADPRAYNGYQLLTTDGTVLQSGGFAPPFIPLPVEPRAGEVVMQRENGVISATMSIDTPSGTHWVRVVRSLQDLESISGQLLLRALPEFTPMLLVVLLGMAAVVVLTVHQTLRPVRETSRQAALLSAERLSERLPETRVPREVLPLVQAVNVSLERLERDYQTQREFTAHAAHELRTPLAVLRARLEAHLSREEMRDVAQEIEGLARLIEQLLSLAQLDSDATIPSSSVDAYACAIEVAREIAPRALDTDHRVGAAALSTPVLTQANATLLRQVFRNLIENAIQHTPSGTTITLSARNATTVAVEDDGPGVPAAEREQIFERFRRGSTASGSGAGLGLAVARRILERMGGQLVLDPEVGGGARFLVILAPPA